MSIRKFVIRILRRIILKLNYYEKNDPSINGEYFFLTKSLVNKRDAILIDIGGYSGDWSEFSFLNFKNNIKNIFIFEPFESAFKRINDKFKNYKIVTIYNKAMSNEERQKVKFFFSNADSGNSSLLKLDNDKELKISTTTIDKFILRKKIKNVVFIKIDTEGHDFFVIKGALDSLISNKIECLQFEYNWRWIHQKSSLKDIFNLVEANELKYKIGRLTKNKILLFDQWHPELDNYIESNFILISNKNTTLNAFMTPMTFNENNILKCVK